MIALLLAAAIQWPQQYNAGVTAYHSNDLAAAATAFEQATAAPSRELQQRAFYNLGNTAYRFGEADPANAENHWQRAVNQYESALALNPNDEDAKFNREFVKKKIEELKQQQQQQNQQQQDQQKQDATKPDDQQQDQQSQQQPPPQNTPDQQQPETSRSDAKPQSEQPPKPEQQQPAPNELQPADNLDKQRAAAMLDNLREDERNWNFYPEVQMKDLKDAGAPVKDW
jgi:Ca-activated chloride channel family protein